MRRMLSTMFAPAGILLLLAICARADVVISVATDKEEYSVGEAMEFRITATNNAAIPTLLQFTGTQAMYMLMDRRQFVFPNYSGALSEEEKTRLLPANGSFTWTFRHRWELYDLPTGEHEVVGRVNATGLSASKPAKFRVIEPPPPMKSFTINFETLPESKTPVRELGEYRAWSVRFKIIKSLTGELTVVRRKGDDKCLAVTSANLPTGYNIAADLKVQTNEVAAEVSIKPGLMVKMIARDSEGAVLDESVSPKFTEPDTFLPLRVVSKDKDTFIASVEFWPSAPSTPLMMDNLAIKVE